MTSHLVFRSNQGHISYRLRDKRRFTSKMASFPHPRLFNAPAEGVARWNFVTAVALEKKLKSCLYQTVERVWYVHSFRYNTRVWRTDGRTDLPQQYRALHACERRSAIKIQEQMLAFRVLKLKLELHTAKNTEMNWNVLVHVIYSRRDWLKRNFGQPRHLHYFVLKFRCSTTISPTEV